MCMQMFGGLRGLQTIMSCRQTDRTDFGGTVINGSGTPAGHGIGANIFCLLGKSLN